MRLRRAGEGPRQVEDGAALGPRGVEDRRMGLGRDPVGRPADDAAVGAGKRPGAVGHLGRGERLGREAQEFLELQRRLLRQAQRGAAAEWS